MKLRRCAILLIEPCETLKFSVPSLLAGGTGMDASLALRALAPHLDAPVAVTLDEVAVLAAMSPTRWRARTEVSAGLGAAPVRRLLRAGLLIGNGAAYRGHRERDEVLRRAHWHPAAAVLHFGGRWSGIAAGVQASEAGLRTMHEMIAALGPPPPAWTERVGPARRLPLARDDDDGFGGLVARRTTCRNFEPAPIGRQAFDRILHRAGAAYSRMTLGDGVEVLKKGSPTGGGLSPIECYVLAQRVEGLRPGLYHHHPVDHALEPLKSPRSGRALRALGARMMAEQDYFADASALIVLVARFGRTQWKYRNHAKAYRAVMLEAGHISQTIYLSAVEFGLGVFVTAAINEIDVEQAFGLDPRVESPLAICGIGRSAAEMATFEFRPGTSRFAVRAPEAAATVATRTARGPRSD